MKPKLLTIVGPTASGKTALAIELGRRLGGEVVSADSVQVYRYFDIGSGKPSAEEVREVPHHLLSIVEPEETLEASVWAELASEKIAAIQRRDRLPIVCGGTFLWIRALLFGLASVPPRNEEIRKEHLAFVARSGRPALHQKLAAVDPEIAARLHENDFVRVSRALEVFEISGRKMSDFHAEHGFRESRFDPIFLGVGFEREAYDDRVARRVRTMIRDGLVEEVRSLLARGFGNARAMGAIGYKEVKAALDRETLPSDEELADEVTRSSRIFARRQRTWLREEPIEWLAPEILDRESSLDALAERLRSELSS